MELWAKRYSGLRVRTKTNVKVKKKQSCLGLIFSSSASVLLYFLPRRKILTSCSHFSTVIFFIEYKLQIFVNRPKKIFRYYRLEFLFRIFSTKKFVWNVNSIFVFRLFLLETYMGTPHPIHGHALPHTWACASPPPLSQIYPNLCDLRVAPLGNWGEGSGGRSRIYGCTCFNFKKIFVPHICTVPFKTVDIRVSTSKNF